nr:hypothetical protein CFP56_01036 [Quercus suber]
MPYTLPLRNASLTTITESDGEVFTYIPGGNTAPSTFTNSAGQTVVRGSLGDLTTIPAGINTPVTITKSDGEVVTYNPGGTVATMFPATTTDAADINKIVTLAATRVADHIVLSNCAQERIFMMADAPEVVVQANLPKMVDCAVTEFGTTSTTSTCTSTSCSETTTCAIDASRVTTTTSETITAICPLSRPPCSVYAPADPTAPPLVLVSDGKYTFDTFITPPKTTASSTTLGSIPIESTTLGSKTSFASCSTQNEDPEQCFTKGYCVCSGSTFAQFLNTAVTPANSCAYTSLPSTTLASQIQTITTTISSACFVCAIVGTSTSCASQIDTPDNGGYAFCYGPSTGRTAQFSFDDAQSVALGFCNSIHVLQPGNAFDYNEEGSSSDVSVKIVVSAAWAPDQTGCEPEGSYTFNAEPSTYQRSWELDFDCTDESTIASTSYGGGYVLNTTVGCILFTLLGKSA